MKKLWTTPDPRPWTARLQAWFGERVDAGELVAMAAKKTVPVHRLSWIYGCGGVALFAFAMQVATGALLMLYYQPSEATAHASVQRIMTDVPYGWLIRSMHAWGANLFIAAAVVHMVTVLFTRSYRKPRELTWISGTALLALALAFGFSGYLLPWNVLSYYATLVGTQLPGAIPVVGDVMVHFLRGGDQVTGDTITRFFAAHVMLLPLGFGLILGVHLLLVQLQGMSLPLGMKADEVRDHRPFFTEFVLAEAGLWLVLLGAIVTLAVFFPAEVGAKADPLQPAPEGIKPEWYFLFMFQTIKHVPELVGVLFFLLIGVALVVLPLVDRWSAREERSPALTWVFLALTAYVVVFEAIGVLAPGVKHTPAEDAAVGVSSGQVVSLAMMWAVIGYLVFYLRQLLVASTRLRQLYRSGSEGSAGEAGS